MMEQSSGRRGFLCFTAHLSLEQLACVCQGAEGEAGREGFSTTRGLPSDRPTASEPAVEGNSGSATPCGAAQVCSLTVTPSNEFSAVLVTIVLLCPISLVITLL